MKRLVMAIACAALVACASSGTNFNEDAVARLVPTQTTETEAVALLGAKPYSRTIVKADGGYVLTWIHVRIGPINHRSRGLSVLFDKDGKMVRINHQSDSNPD